MHATWIAWHKAIENPSDDAESCRGKSWVLRSRAVNADSPEAEEKRRPKTDEGKTALKLNAFHIA
jgi:hypothetical protein